MTDRDFMQHAYEMAKRAEGLGEVPVGAVIVKNDKVIAEGWNRPISESDPTAHAEIVALRNAAKLIQNYRLLDTTLYVTLEPCAMCLGAILHARVKRLVFGAYDPRAGAVESVFQLADEGKLNHRLNCTGGVMAEPCGQLLKDFFRSRR